MQTTKCAVILAAGNGSRLRYVSRCLPKPLVQLGSKPLLEHVILALQVAGIERFVIVVGYGRDAICSWLEARHFPGAHVEVVENRHYLRSNGISVLKARGIVREPFLLVMADHVFEPKTAANLLRQPIEADAAILAVDYKLQTIFDMNDATKVACKDKHIIQIGKDLPNYNAVDTGMFVCTPAIFSALEQSIVNGDCTLSDGMRVLAARRKLFAFDIGDGIWQDVDTPEALEYASSFVLKHCRIKQNVLEAVGV